LIKHEPDARHMLGLNASGSTYCSGLTVLIDDIDGKLPLNPTKQDVAFGEQANGDVHKKNLFIWVGSITKFFYDYHLAKYFNKKQRLTAKIKGCGTDLIQTEVKEIDRCQLTSFNANFKNYAKKSIRIDQKSVQQIVGSDTHFSLVCDRPPAVNLPSSVTSASDTPVSKKRKITHAQGQVPTEPNQPSPVNSGDIARTQMQNANRPGAATQAFRPISNHPQGGVQQQTNTGQLPAPPNCPSSARNPQQHPPQHFQQPDHRHTNGTQPQMNLHDQRMQLRQQLKHHGTQQLHQHRSSSQPTSQNASDGGASTSQNVACAVQKDAEIIDLLDDSSRDSASPVASNTEALGDNENGGMEANGENAAVANAENNDEDDDSVSSAKDYYKDLCSQLTLGMEKKKESDNRMKKENRNLKEEIFELRNEVGRLQELLKRSFGTE